MCDQLVVYRMSDLGANCNDHNDECEEDNTFIARVPQLHRTTNAYLIKTNGAARLLQLCRPLSYQLDTMMTLRTSHSDTCKILNQSHNNNNNRVNTNNNLQNETQ